MGEIVNGVRGYANLPLDVLEKMAKEFKVLRPRILRELLIRAEGHKKAMDKAQTAIESNDEKSLLTSALIVIGKVHLLDYEEMSPEVRAKYSFNAMSMEEKQALVRAMLDDSDMDEEAQS